MRQELRAIEAHIIELLSGELCMVNRAVLKALSHRRKGLLSH